MSMLQVPSQVPGARSLPAELRTPAHVPQGNAWGWHRLHNNLTPVTSQTGVSGLGTEGTMIPVDQPIPMPPQPTISAYSGGGMPLYIQQLISSGAITPQLPPRPVNAPGDSHLQHTPWGYIWAKVVKTQNGPVITWMNQRPDVLMATNPDAVGVSGLGTCDPTTGLDDFTGAYCGGAITESQYPVVFSDGTTGTASTSDWANLISSSTNALTQILAVSQGGSVSASGNIYGSPQTATVAAGFPQNQLSVSGAGLSGALSTPMILLAVGALVLITMSGRR